MDRNKTKTTIACFIGTIILALSTPTQSIGQGADASRKRAVALWEEAIRAKGGHERLQSINNFLISSMIDTEAQRGNSTKEAERLYAMPGKAWIYTITPTFDVSVDATVINHERNFCMVTLSPAGGGVLFTQEPTDMPRYCSPPGGFEVDSAGPQLAFLTQFARDPQPVRKHPPPRI